MGGIHWIVTLFFFTLVIGILAPIGGVGGGILFVPLATAFFPFNVDFIRGAGLIVALSSSLSSSPYFLKKGMANIKIMIPVVVVSMVTSIIGSVVGLWFTNVLPQGGSYFSISLGALLFFIFFIMMTSKQIEFPEIVKIDRISQKLVLRGAWYEPSLEKTVEYRTTNLSFGMLCFSAVGFIAGMFGIGAGWASVPVMNIILGAPIKVSVATGMTIIAVNNATAAWVYISRGATLPVVCIPSVAGISLGARIGARLSVKAKPQVIKYLVLGIMIFAALLNIGKGLHGIGIL